MGTVVSFDFRSGELDATQVQAALRAACAVLHDADAAFSTWKPDSPLNRYRRGEVELADMPPETYDVLELCMRAHRLTSGWFDAWSMPGGFDPTGLVKGWAAARALDVLVSAGVAAAVVNAGGDIAVHGTPEAGRTWEIGIALPADPTQVACTVAVAASIATSGTYERGEHVLDPHTGQPADAFASVTVVGPELAIADAYATAIVAGGAALLETIEASGYAALLIEHDGTARSSPTFPVLEPHPH